MFEEKMILKADKIGLIMERLNWTPRVFAEVLKIEMRESYKLLSGEAVNYYTAKAFIVYFKAAFAVAFIDFAAMEMEPPKFLLKQIAINEAALLSNIASNIKNAQKEKKRNNEKHGNSTHA